LNFSDFAWKISTYRPVELGDVEFEILGYFATRISASTYEVFKTLNTVSLATRNKPASYKNIHKRVKRILQLNLIEEIIGQFERGAKHYRVSTYGLICYAGRTITESDNHIKHNKKNIAIQSLLQFFEEKSIDSFILVKTFPAREIRDYLRDCCAVTIDICNEEWNKIKRYQIEDILPSDEVIQKYMSYLDGKKVNQSILNEVIEYEKRLLNKSQSDENLRLIYHEFRNKVPASKKGRFPPFPLGEIYDNIVCRLRCELEKKIKSLTNNIVTRLGEIADSEDMEIKAQADYSLAAILTDKNFLELAKIMKENFVKGYAQLQLHGN
jgi:hypothetical protein